MVKIATALALGGSAVMVMAAPTSIPAPPDIAALQSLPLKSIFAGLEFETLYRNVTGLGCADQKAVKKQMRELFLAGVEYGEDNQYYHDQASLEDAEASRKKVVEALREMKGAKGEEYAAAREKLGEGLKEIKEIKEEAKDEYDGHVKRDVQGNAKQTITIDKGIISNPVMTPPPFII